jgi:competence protein ComEA
MDDLTLKTTWRDRLEMWAGRRFEVVVLAALVVVVAGGALLLWMRGRPATIAPPATARAARSAPAQLIVHVAGAVARPGVYELPEGRRVVDAVEAAGGARRGADLDALNLAEAVIDGMKIDVPRRGAPVAMPTPGTPAGTAIDVNTADQPALEAIPGIGPVKAAAIIEHRTRAGPFAAVEDLLDVTGIGPATLESIRPYVTV